jgi:hypothetical protein
MIRTLKRYCIGSAHARVKPLVLDVNKNLRES